MTGHFKTEITVRYAETDRMGVAYYANYFVWFEIARTEYFRSLGVSYSRIEKEKNVFMMVVDARCKYMRPVTYDERVTVETWVSEVKMTSVTFAYKLYRQDTLIAEGATSHVFTNADKKPVRIPGEIADILK